MNMRRFKQLCGIVITSVSIGLIYVFIRSEAWFGVMIGLFLGAVGIQAIAQPERIFRAGKSENEAPPVPHYGQGRSSSAHGTKPEDAANE
ncbi:MAG: hypothetical protein GKR94_28925 [Gammaproteobacteria bacterium]|nr:hypothetical protein [Gammaproteobacteria bacterium]